MIRELFLPRYIAGRCILPQRVVGIDIARTYINASQVYVKDTTITIEKCITQPLEAGNNTNYDERVIDALKELKPQLDPYTLLRSTIPSSIAVIKELTLPFIEPEKIKMVLEYEVEPLLPFPINDAIIDGIITKVMPEENKSLVLVAAVPKEYIAHHLQLLQAAHLDPDIISIDFFDLYELYRILPHYKEQDGTQILIDIETHTTRIGYVYNGALRIVRTLPKGITNLIKLMSDSLGMQPSAVLEQIIRFGFNHDDRSFTQALREALDAFWQDIAFTLTSCTQSDTKIDTILLLGAGAEIPGLNSFITEKAGTTCEKIDINQITHLKNIVTKQSGTIAQNCIMSLASALNFKSTSMFNLRKKEFASAKTPLITKQILTAGMLSCAIILGLIGYTVYEISSLHRAISSSTEELSKEIIERFAIPQSEENNELDDLIAAAQRKVAQREQLMFAFSGAHRKSFLQYLSELTTIIHKEALDLTLNRLQIADNAITLEGKVANFDEIKALQDDLRSSKLFTYNGRVQDFAKFTIKIPLGKTGGRS